MPKTYSNFNFVLGRANLEQMHKVILLLANVSQYSFYPTGPPPSYGICPLCNVFYTPHLSTKLNPQPSICLKVNTHLTHTHKVNLNPLFPSSNLMLYYIFILWWNSTPLNHIHAPFGSWPPFIKIPLLFP